MSTKVPGLARLPLTHPLRALLSALPPVELGGPLLPHPARWWDHQELGLALVPGLDAVGEEDHKAVAALTARALVEESWVLAQTLALHLGRASGGAATVDERRLSVELAAELLRAGEQVGTFLPEPRAWLAPSRLQRWAAELGEATTRATLLVVAVGVLGSVLESRTTALARTARSDALREGLRALEDAARRAQTYASILVPRGRGDLAELEVLDCLGALVPILVDGPEALPLAVERVLGPGPLPLEARAAVRAREAPLERVHPLVTWLLGLSAEQLAEAVTGLACAPPLGRG